MEPNVFDKVHDIDLKSTMEKSYIDYAMSVIVSRAFSVRFVRSVVQFYHRIKDSALNRF